eukprot:6201255-Pleurochrysis_carterae.AAC.8
MEFRANGTLATGTAKPTDLLAFHVHSCYYRMQYWDSYIFKDLTGIHNRQSRQVKLDPKSLRKSHAASVLAPFTLRDERGGQRRPQRAASRPEVRPPGLSDQVADSTRN